MVRLSQKKMRTEEKEKLHYKELGNNENCTCMEDLWSEGDRKQTEKVSK